MDSIRLGGSYLSKEESKYLIEVLAKKRNIKKYKLYKIISSKKL